MFSFMFHFSVVVVFLILLIPVIWFLLNLGVVVGWLLKGFPWFTFLAGGLPLAAAWLFPKTFFSLYLALLLLGAYNRIYRHWTKR